jgi:uncharacterized membrane protein
VSTDLDPAPVDRDVPDEPADLDVDHPAAPYAPPRLWGLALVVGGALGLAAAFTLAVDKYRILADPTYQPSCNLNPVLSCGSVMVTGQAEVFGFPNPLLGIIGFTAVIGLGLLVAMRVALPRLVLVGLSLASLAGLVFVHWLAFQSLYRIGALCPWCMVVWAVTIPIAVTATLVALRSLGGAAGRAASVVWDVRYLVVVLWYLVFVVAIGIEFWSYWRTLL